MGRPFPIPEPIPLDEQDGQSFPALVALMRRLLAPDGCPWDREQSMQSLRKYVLEEACEVIDAVDQGDRKELCDELGDLALQVVFLSEVLRGEDVALEQVDDDCWNVVYFTTLLARWDGRLGRLLSAHSATTV